MTPRLICPVSLIITYLNRVIGIHSSPMCFPNSSCEGRKDSEQKYAEQRTRWWHKGHTGRCNFSVNFTGLDAPDLLFFFFFSFLERPHLFSNSIQSIYCSLCRALCPLDVSALLWALLRVLWKQGQTICIGEMRLLYCHFCFTGLSFVSQGFQVGHHSLLSSPQMLAGYVDPTLLWLTDFTTHGNVVGSP